MCVPPLVYTLGCEHCHKSKYITKLEIWPSFSIPFTFSFSPSSSLTHPVDSTAKLFLILSPANPTVHLFVVTYTLNNYHGFPRIKSQSILNNASVKQVILTISGVQTNYISLYVYICIYGHINIEYLKLDWFHVIYSNY